MTVGDPSVFAIESGITQAYSRLSFRALGYFVIHIGACRYGVFAPDATMLACSFDEVGARIARRGKHVAPFSKEAGGAIANAYFLAKEGVGKTDEEVFGIVLADFLDLVYSRDLVWAPDGDEAFDDGSFVLHFDVGNRVRLIGFNTTDCTARHHYDAATFHEVWLDANEYYNTLEMWRDAFIREWEAAPKISEEDDQRPPAFGLANAN